MILEILCTRYELRGLNRRFARAEVIRFIESYILVEPGKGIDEVGNEGVLKQTSQKLLMRRKILFRIPFSTPIRYRQHQKDVRIGS